MRRVLADRSETTCIRRGKYRRLRRRDRLLVAISHPTIWSRTRRPGAIARSSVAAGASICEDLSFADDRRQLHDHPERVPTGRAVGSTCSTPLAGGYIARELRHRGQLRGRRRRWRDPYCASRLRRLPARSTNRIRGNESPQSASRRRDGAVIESSPVLLSQQLIFERNRTGSMNADGGALYCTQADARRPQQRRSSTTTADWDGGGHLRSGSESSPGDRVRTPFIGNRAIGTPEARSRSPGTRLPEIRGNVEIRGNSVGPQPAAAFR